MLPAHQRQRPGRISLWWAAACFAAFGLLAGLVYLSRPAVTADPGLARELEGAALVEEAAGGSAEGDWPQWRGPRRDGVSRERGLLAEWPAQGPPVLWRIKGGAGFSSLAVAQGRLFTILQDGSDEVVLCLNADTGKELWRFPYPATFAESMGGPGPRSTPTVDGDYLYTVGATGMLHCLEAATGTQVWQHDLLAEFGARNLQWGVSFSPLVDSDLVFTNPGGPNGGSVAAFHKRTGDLAWKALDDPAGYSSPIAIDAAGARQIIFFTGTRLVSVAPTDGKFYWAFPWPTSNMVNAATPIFFEALAGEQVFDYLFISSGYGKGCAVLKIVATGPGSVGMHPVYINNQMRNQFASSVRWKDYFYGLDDPSMLACVAVKSGESAWKHRGFSQGAVLVADDRLIILDGAGTLTLAEAAGSGYHEISSFKALSGKCWTAPALAHGKLYLRDQAEIVCLDLRRKP
jgi:outer membrane protein assembly factor BamB